MVQIIIKRVASSLDEYFLIELQGDLKLKGDTLNKDLGSNFIGDLHFNNENIPILIISHHILFGKCVILDKPMAVMEKRTLSRDEYSDGTKSPLEYMVQGIIKRKLEFRSRPKPIVVMQPTKP